MQEKSDQSTLYIYHINIYYIRVVHRATYKIWTSSCLDLDNKSMYGQWPLVILSFYRCVITYTHLISHTFAFVDSSFIKGLMFTTTFYLENTYEFQCIWLQSTCKILYFCWICGLMQKPSQHFLVLWYVCCTPE